MLARTKRKTIGDSSRPLIMVAEEKICFVYFEVDLYGCECREDGICVLVDDRRLPFPATIHQFSASLGSRFQRRLLQ